MPADVAHADGARGTDGSALIVSPPERPRRSVCTVRPAEHPSGPRGSLEAVRRVASGAAQKLGDRLPPAVAGHLPVPASGHHVPAQQTLTIAASAVQVLGPWSEPSVLGRLLGDLGSVEATGTDSYRWTFGSGDGSNAPAWDTTLVRRHDGLRFEGGGSSLELTTSPAPRGLGTEARLRADLPIPSAAAGAAAFTLLYRLRALLQTGEIPTLRPQPAARDERG